MASYAFYDHAHERVNLDIVEKEFAEAAGIPPEQLNENTFHPLFGVLVEVGFSILMKSGGLSVTPAGYADWLAAPRTVALNQENLELAEKMRPFLDGTKYTFEGWR